MLFSVKFERYSSNFASSNIPERDAPGFIFVKENLCFEQVLTKLWTDSMLFSSSEKFLKSFSASISESFTYPSGLMRKPRAFAWCRSTFDIALDRFACLLDLLPLGCDARAFPSGFPGRPLDFMLASPAIAFSISRLLSRRPARGRRRIRATAAAVTRRRSGGRGLLLPAIPAPGPPPPPPPPPTTSKTTNLCVWVSYRCCRRGGGGLI
mmetsp:Transcript_5042/g.12201  ORF Transcript_5042/g.12201 Transcript_5042/m.12201 type:complete len:209 (-) Transcript_5042:51-677(-)